MDTRERGKQILTAAAQILADYGGVTAIDNLPNDARRPTILALTKAIKYETGCHPETARRNLAKAMRRARYEIVKERKVGKPTPDFTVGRIDTTTDGQDNVTYWVITLDDGTDEFVIGEWPALGRLTDLLVETKANGGQNAVIVPEVNGLYLTPNEAVEMATAQGIPISSRIVRNAASRGDIAGAIKAGSGQWQLPKPAFQGWLDDRKQREV